MSKIDFLTNNNYKVLKTISDNTVLLMGTKYCPLSQSEIASIVGINRIACGNIINDLREEGFINDEKSGSKKYVLTDEANKILKILEKIN